MRSNEKYMIYAYTALSLILAGCSTSDMDKARDIYDAAKPDAPIVRPEQPPQPLAWTTDKDGKPIPAENVTAIGTLVKVADGRRLYVHEGQHYMRWPSRSDWFRMEDPARWSSRTLWKADSDHGPLAILMHKRFIWTGARAEIRRSAKVLETSGVQAPYHDGRICFRWRRAGAGYGPGPVTLRVYMLDGGFKEWTVGAPAVRIDNLGEPN